MTLKLNGNQEPTIKITLSEGSREDGWRILANVNGAVHEVGHLDPCWEARDGKWFVVSYDVELDDNYSLDDVVGAFRDIGLGGVTPFRLWASEPEQVAFSSCHNVPVVGVGQSAHAAAKRAGKEYVARVVCAYLEAMTPEPEPEPEPENDTRPSPEDMSRDDVTRLLTEFAALHTGNGAAAVGDDNATLSHMSDDPAYLERFVVRSRALSEPANGAPCNGDRGYRQLVHFDGEKPTMRKLADHLLHGLGPYSVKMNEDMLGMIVRCRDTDNRVSVQWGHMNYCENRDNSDIQPGADCVNAEVAIWGKEGNHRCDDYDDVVGWQTPSEVKTWLVWANSNKVKPTVEEKPCGEREPEPEPEPENDRRPALYTLTPSYRDAPGAMEQHGPEEGARVQGVYMMQIEGEEAVPFSGRLSRPSLALNTLSVGFLTIGVEFDESVDAGRIRRDCAGVYSDVDKRRELARTGLVEDERTSANGDREIVRITNGLGTYIEREPEPEPEPSTVSELIEIVEIARARLADVDGDDYIGDGLTTALDAFVAWITTEDRIAAEMEHESRETSRLEGGCL